MLHSGEYGTRLTLAQISSRLMDLLSHVADTPSWKHLWVRYPLVVDPVSLLAYLRLIETNDTEVKHAQGSGPHDAPTRGPSTRFPPNSVELAVALDESSQVGGTAALIASIMRILFAPWITSQVMKLGVDESPLPKWDDVPGVDLTISFP